MFGVSAFRKLEEDVIMPKWCVAKNLQKKKKNLDVNWVGVEKMKNMVKPKGKGLGSKKGSMGRSVRKKILI
jgi:hypothetical protein